MAFFLNFFELYVSLIMIRNVHTESWLCFYAATFPPPQETYSSNWIVIIISSVITFAHCYSLANFKPLPSFNKTVKFQIRLMIWIQDEATVRYIKYNILSTQLIMLRLPHFHWIGPTGCLFAPSGKICFMPLFWTPQK